jgi:hypothetical protein
MLARIPSLVLLLVVLAVLLAGCGGGGQSGDGSQDGGGAEQQGGEAANQPAPQKKIALGTIRSVNVEARRVVLEPSTEQQGDGPLTFNVRKNAEISLDDQPAEMADIQSGQQAQIEYVTKKERNRAVAVRLISDGG